MSIKADGERVFGIPHSHLHLPPVFPSFLLPTFGYGLVIATRLRGKYGKQARRVNRPRNVR